MLNVFICFRVMRFINNIVSGALSKITKTRFKTNFLKF
jgi:hypothetical protein